MAEPPTQPKAKMVIIYAHKDRSDLRKSQLDSYLRNLAKVEGLELWWDMELKKSLWDEEIKRRLNDADIIIMMVSEAFLASDYISNVEAVITSERVLNEGILAVPILLKPSSWKQHEWLTRLNYFPRDTEIERTLHGHLNRYQVYLDIVNYIRGWLGEQGPIRDPRMLRGLRRASESSLSTEQIRVLVNDSCKRAREVVRNDKVREKITEAARELMKKQGRALNKGELARLDKKFLAGGTRKPDPKYVRWVLRCARLHPQGKS